MVIRSLKWLFGENACTASRIATILTGLVFVLLFLATVGMVSAQEGPQSVTDDEVNDVAKDLFCPVCESTPLDVCPTQACADWREVIRTKLSEGQTTTEIRAYFAEQYGARALSEPPREGFTLAVWILPIAAVIIGALLFGRYLSGLRSGEKIEASSAQADQSAITTGPTVGGDHPQDDYEARIERELREL